MRQRRPSEKVNEHKDARSFDLSEDIKVSLELGFGICCRSKSENRKWKMENGKWKTGKQEPVGMPSEGLRTSRRYKQGPKTETPRSRGAILTKNSIRE